MTPCVWLLEKCHGATFPSSDIGWLRNREVLLCCQGFPQEERVGIVQDAVEHCIPHPKNSIGNNSFAFPALCENNALREMQCQMRIVLLKYQFLLVALGGFVLPEKLSGNKGIINLEKSNPPKTTEEDFKFDSVSW